MTPTTSIPIYPDSPPTLLCALCDREMARLLGPTSQQAIADDKTGDTKLAYATAMAALRAAKAWAESATLAPLPGERN